MCRLLIVKLNNQKPKKYLESFAEIAKNSKVYQGHGWGCCYLKKDKWEVYRNIKPVWEDNFADFPETDLIVAHARSAFKDEGIIVENNMPFIKKNIAFIFNGELHGVKVKSEGRIGAEKIFNYILRFYENDLYRAFEKAVGIIEKRTEYIRAMNIIMSDKKKIYLSSLYNEDEEYFNLHFKKTDEEFIICSEPFPGEQNWQVINNKTVKVIEL